ncbi:MAG: N-6 DNA methylase [Dysgonomonas sp.]
MLSSEIKNKIQLLWDRLWGGGLSNPITAIENISYLLFMKRLEKFHLNVENKYKWSNYNTLQGNELKKRINDVFSYIQKNLANEDEPFAVEMKKAKFEITTPSLLEDSVKIIDDVFAKIEEEEAKNQYFQDLQGDVYEYLLNATSQAGKNGQFRTPRHIIQMMVELVQPNIKEKNTKICDVTSGSSGFLVGSYQYILKENSSHIELDDDNQLEKGLDGEELSVEDKIRLKENTFVGFDIDATMVRIGMMNMMMHGISIPDIIHINTLSSDYEHFFLNDKSLLEPVKDERIAQEKHEKYEKLFTELGKEQFDYILANPPFSAKLNSNSVSKNLNRVYTIKEDAKKAQPLQTELLFLERIVYMLKKGGKAAVIVPEGVLFSSSGAYKNIREILLKDCNLEAVISLPNGVFNPYTGVKTSILLFTKKEFNSNTFNTKRVWFYGMESDGYTLDSSRKKIINCYPLPEVINHFRNRTSMSKENKKNNHFYIRLSEIEENGYELNYNLYKEFVLEEYDYEPPMELLEKIYKLEHEIFSSLENLKEEMR